MPDHTDDVYGVFWLQTHYLFMYSELRLSRISFVSVSSDYWEVRWCIESVTSLQSNIRKWNDVWYDDEQERCEFTGCAVKYLILLYCIVVCNHHHTYPVSHIRHGVQIYSITQPYPWLENVINFCSPYIQVFHRNAGTCTCTLCSLNMHSECAIWKSSIWPGQKSCTWLIFELHVTLDFKCI